ncbi:MAG: hypothetical protein KGN78_13240 [Actinomycetales bacterium]|nr:hypothetical protein [Actinomycetales bacterium]
MEEIEKILLRGFDPDAKKVQWRTPARIAMECGLSLAEDRRSKLIFLGKLLRRHFGQPRGSKQGTIYKMPLPRNAQVVAALASLDMKEPVESMEDLARKVVAEFAPLFSFVSREGNAAMQDARDRIVNTVQALGLRWQRLHEQCERIGDLLEECVEEVFGYKPVLGYSLDAEVVNLVDHLRAELDKATKERPAEEGLNPHPDGCWSHSASVRDCEGDGHYMCRECARFCEGRARANPFNAIHERGD